MRSVKPRNVGREQECNHNGRMATERQRAQVWEAELGKISEYKLVQMLGDFL